MSRKTSRDSYNKANEKQRSNIISGRTIAIFFAVALIVIANVFCVLAVCYPEWFNITITETLKGSEKIEASLLSVCISIIGLAVAVWTGLNIANSIDKRHVDELRNNINDLSNEVKTQATNINDDYYKINKDVEIFKSQIKENENLRKKEQNNVDKGKLLHEMYFTADDETTKKLIEKVAEISNEYNAPFLQLVEVEQKYRSVYAMHRSEFNQDEDLLKEAAEGIEIAETIMSKVYSIPSLCLYLNYRMGCFNFYSGYCCLGKDRVNFYEKAIYFFEDCTKLMDAFIPKFDSDVVSLNTHFIKCKDAVPGISAHLCNSIGESYSKIIQIKTSLIKNKICSEEQMDDYGKHAVFYCGYANFWVDKNVYKRNYACALERHFGFKTPYYQTICDEYLKALIKGADNVNNFKNVVSIYDKHINLFLEINFASPNKKRNPSLDSDEFAKHLIKIDAKGNEDFKKTLSELHKLALQTKTIHPKEYVGYQYDCIYYRDRCAVFGNYKLENDTESIAKAKENAQKYLDLAEENWVYLNLIAPFDPDKPNVNPMTQILRNDLDDLKNLL